MYYAEVGRNTSACISTPFIHPSIIRCVRYDRYIGKSHANLTPRTITDSCAHNRTLRDR